jgi:glycosyltransferase involved in cell wall biosynthesis
MAVDYSIVIPAFNEEEFLPATLAAVRAAMAAQTGACGELIVVDNNSTDRTAAVARSLGAQVVFEPVNQISRARNCGAAAALGR